jgi:hypothetical protein
MYPVDEHPAKQRYALCNQQAASGSTSWIGMSLADRDNLSELLRQRDRLLTATQFKADELAKITERIDRLLCQMPNPPQNLINASAELSDPAIVRLFADG